MTRQYDICFICFDELKSDARTLNLARTYIKQDKKIAIIAPSSQEDKVAFSAEGIDVFPVNPPKNKRFWTRWLLFHSRARKFKKIEASIYWANDFYSLYTASWLASSRKSKLYYDSREIYSALGPLAHNQVKQSVITEMEKKLVANVDRIIVSGEMDAEYLKNHFNIKKDYSVIMNLPPYKDAFKSNRIREELGISSDKKILLYQGVIVKGRGIMPVIRALPCLEDVEFCIIGWGPHEQDFKELAQALNVDDRVHFLGKKPYDELCQYTASADIGIAYIEPVTLSYRLALPNKLFEYCMARVPSLVSDLPAMKKTLQEFKIGELIQVGAEPEVFARCLRKILDNKDAYIAECEKASRKYCYEAQVETILNLIK
jgi:glycosyltransferase involved in cell wall biosynthesis